MSLDVGIKVINRIWLGLYRLQQRNREIRLVDSRSQEVLNNKDFREEYLFKLLCGQIESYLPTYKSTLVPKWYRTE